MRSACRRWRCTVLLARGRCSSLVHPPSGLSRVTRPCLQSRTRWASSHEQGGPPVTNKVGLQSRTRWASSNEQGGPPVTNKVGLQLRQGRPPVKNKVGGPPVKIKVGLQSRTRWASSHEQNGPPIEVTSCVNHGYHPNNESEMSSESLVQLNNRSLQQPILSLVYLFFLCYTHEP